MLTLWYPTASVDERELCAGLAYFPRSTSSAELQTGRDAVAYTYGSFNAGLNAGLNAGRDVVGVTAVGSVNGAITACRNVDEVFAYRDITAAVLARNTAGTSTGGRIGSVRALGGISGIIAADGGISEIASAGSVDAQQQAASVESMRTNDSSLIAANPPPTAPESIRDELLAEANAARDALFADVAAIQDLLTEASS